MKKYIVASEEIYSMATIGINRDPKFSVAVNPDSNRVGEAYFKYYDDAHYSKANHVARISFMDAKYIKHHRGKKQWKLTKRDIRNLVEFLNNRHKAFVNLTNWDVAKFFWNLEYGNFYADYPVDNYETEMDAYFDGYYDNLKENKNNPSYVPSYQEMPDYVNNLL